MGEWGSGEYSSGELGCVCVCVRKREGGGSEALNFNYVAAVNC